MKITLKKSLIGSKKDQIATAISLGLKKVGDTTGRTLCAASTLDKSFNGYGGNKEAAREVGKMIAQKAAEKGITNVVFDRGGYIFHGRVKELAEGAREGGLNF